MFRFNCLPIVVLVAALAAGCGFTAVEGTSCQTSADCPSGELCHAGACEQPATDLGLDACVSEDNWQFCLRHGFSCGEFSAPDNCGLFRRVVCQGCISTDGCVPESNEQLCQARYLDCGAAAVTDSCGSPRQLDCGACRSGFYCDGSNHCQAEHDQPDACVPEDDSLLCANVYWECGNTTVTDHCGTVRTVSCGSCASGSYCEYGSGQCYPNYRADFGPSYADACGSLRCGFWPRDAGY